MATNHKKTIRDLITGQGLNTPDSEIYRSPLHEDMANQCVAMFDIPSGEPDSFFEDNERWRFAEVQVRVRGPADKHTEVDQDARDIYDLVDNAKPSGYLKTVASQSNPRYLDTDEDGNHHYFIQFQLWIIE